MEAPHSWGFRPNRTSRCVAFPLSPYTHQLEQFQKLRQQPLFRGPMQHALEDAAGGCCRETLEEAKPPTAVSVVVFTGDPYSMAAPCQRNPHEVTPIGVNDQVCYVPFDCRCTASPLGCSLSAWYATNMPLPQISREAGPPYHLLIASVACCIVWLGSAVACCQALWDGQQ